MPDKVICFGVIDSNEISASDANLYEKTRVCTEHEQMPFDMAFGAMRQYGRDFAIARDGWNGKGMHVTVRALRIKDNLYIQNPVLVLKNAQGGYNTWVPSSSDIMAEDWHLIRMKKEGE